MAGIIQSDPGTIIRACRAQVIAASAVDAALVKVAQRRNPPTLSGDKDCLLRLGGFVTLPETFDGAGRTCSVIQQDLEVTCRSRLYLDDTDNDLEWLDNESLGHIDWLLLCTQALQGFWPADAGDNLLTREPIRISRGQGPEKDRAEPAWGESTVIFAFEYLFLFRQAEL